MANIKSAKKRALQSEKRRVVNAARKTAIKTSTKALLDAMVQGKDLEALKVMLKDVESKAARAKSKHVMHKNAAARKVSRLAKRINAYTKTGAKGQ
jgi:small subunit ribosomal protein S20